jgi:uncharacterized protein YpuA (DUF1002 family)
LDKNLTNIQENYIDVKDSLKKLDKKENKSFLEKIIEFFKSLFN